MIPLTQDQHSALKSGLPVRVPYPEFGQDVVILSAEAFAALEEVLQDEKDQAAIVRMALRTTTQRLLEDENG